jgi:hypothetical protein
VPGQSFGITWRFFGFSGQDHFSCARAEKERRVVKESRPRILAKDLDDMVLSSERSRNGNRLGLIDAWQVIWGACLTNECGAAASATKGIEVKWNVPLVRLGGK